jgi:transcriptional regulator with XRE-family HTH domain
METTFGSALRQWRGHRRLTQEQLAFDAEISTRHLSCLETAKARPSREMVLVLASALQLDLRDRNVLLTVAGFAPVYAANALDSLALAPVARAVDLMIEKQEPYPAFVLNRRFDVLRLNAAALRLLGHFAPELPRDLMGNLLKALFDPRGLRSVLVNWHELAAHALERLRHEARLVPNDVARAQLLTELLAAPDVQSLNSPGLSSGPTAVVHLRHQAAEARFFTMLTTVGTPFDVGAQELMVETYFPADEATSAWCHS